MNRQYGSQSMIDPLKRVLVKRPDEAFGGANPDAWHYTGKPDLQTACEEHDAFAAILRDAGAEVIYHGVGLPDRADAIFVHDPAVVTDAGAVILRMGKELRRGEEEAMARALESLDIPILCRLRGDARAEGGDLMWVDHDTLAVGLGSRTNAAGLRQLREVVGALGVSVVPVELPEPKSPEACLHLMSLASIVDHGLAVIHRPLLPAPFRRFLEERGFRFVEVPDEEFETMGPNVLALAPGKCLMLEGSPATKRRLEAAGCQVITYRGYEISLKVEGGATCLTRPILRE